jgi:hypothetical protein
MEQSDESSDSDGDTSTSKDGVETNVLSMKGKKARSLEQGDNTSDCNESFDNDSSDKSIVEKDRNPTTKPSSNERMNDFDDFLIAAQETNTFEKVKQDANRITENSAKAGVMQGRRGGEVGTGSVEVSGIGAGQIKAKELGSPLSGGAGVGGGAIPLAGAGEAKGFVGGRQRGQWHG